MSFRATFSSIAARLLQHPLTAAHGLDDEVIDQGAARVGGTIPLALRDYYSVLGGHPLNTAHNRLYAPSQLEFDPAQKCVIFMEENQSVCAWGIQAADLARPDPVAYQGQPDHGDWHSEERTLSEFLVIALYLQCCWGGLEYSGSQMNSVKLIPRLEDPWKMVVDHNGLRIWEREGMLVSHLHGTTWCSGAANTQDSFNLLESEYGFSLERI